MKSKLSKKEIGIIKKLSTPSKIQDYLNSIPFNFEKSGATLMSPRRVMRGKKAHCLEGALFALAVLAHRKQRAFLIDLKSSKKDFDHVVTVWQEKNLFGAVSKTNHAVLRYREPIYKNVRELVMSYFHEYFLNNGTKTLKSYSKPVFAKSFPKNWMTAEDDLWDIGATLDDAPHTSILPKKIKLRKADKIEREAGKIVEWKKK